MKKVIVLFSALFLMTIAAQTVSAQYTATASAVTNAYIVTPIAIAKTVDLSFGKIVPTSLAGTVVVTPASSRSFTGGAYAFTNATGTVTAASFTVTGEVDAHYSIVISNATFDVTLGTTTNTMTVKTISTSATGTLTSGTDILTVGATLEVGVNQAPGSYTNASSLGITVAYN